MGDERANEENEEKDMVYSCMHIERFYLNQVAAWNGLCL